MDSDFRLLMLGAMYENGGNTTHRFLDGHPQMFVYPFESQVGTRMVNDALSSVFPTKYRWPAFALDATAKQDYAAIIDEIYRVKPAAAKGRYLKSVTMATTMGPGIKIDPQKSKDLAEEMDAATA